MFNPELTRAVEVFAGLMFPLSEKDLERTWIWKDHDEEGIRFAIFVTLQELRQLAVTLAANRKSTTQAQHILGQYHKQYMDLQAAIFGLSKEESELAPDKDEWPLRQVYAHILGAEINFSGVVRYALEGHRSGTWLPERMSDEDDIRVGGLSENEYNTLIAGPLKDMLAFHRNFHSKVIEEFSSVTDVELELPSTFWEETRFPIRHRLHRFEAHLVQHTVQIDKTLVTIGRSPGESKRLIRYLFAALAEVDANLIGENNSQAGCEELTKSINSRIFEIQSILQE